MSRKLILAAVLALALLLSGCAADPGSKVTRVEISPLETREPAGELRSYVLNTASRRFHKPGCSAVEKMTEKNKETVTASRDDLIAQGFAPCTRCRP